MWEYHTSGSDNFSVSKSVDAISYGLVYCRQRVRSHLCLHRYVAQLNSKCVITFTRKQFKQTISIYILQETETMFFFWHSDCGGVLTEDNGEVLSPNFPNNYNHSDACAWLILAPEGSRIQVFSISRLNFDFDLLT